jgi:hypothetical protein
MAVGFSNTNKPINPRGQDASPLAFNRAKLFSGKALDFDGVNDSVIVPQDSSLELTQGSWSCWFNIDAFGNYLRIIQKGHNAGSNCGYGMALSNAANVVDFWFRTTAGTEQVKQARNLEINTWYFATGTFDGTYVKVYINGIEVTEDSSVVNYSASDTTLTIGMRAGSVASPFNGEISGVRVFNTALTAAQVADLYNNPEKVVPTGVNNTALKLWLPMMEGAGTTAYDGSGNGNHGTISGATYVNGVGAPVAQSAVMDWNKGANLALYSEQFDRGSYWATLATIVTLNDTTAPDGQETADLLKETTTSAPHYINIGVTTAASTTYVQSIWVKKKDEGIYAGLRTNGAGGDSYIIFDFDTATIVASGTDIISNGVEAYSNGWYRIYMTYTLQPTGVIYSITNSSSSVIPSYTGTGKGYYIWGAQVEATDSLGAYIPNHTATPITTPVLLPQGLTSGRDITGVNLFENVRKQGALNLDGNSWAEVHDNASLDITDAITLEAWVYWDDSSNKGIFGRWHNDSSNRNYLLYKNSVTTINFYINSSAIASYASLNATKGWTHIVGTYNRTNAVLYIDGVQQAITAHTTAISTGTLPVEIGRNFTTSNQALTAPIAQPRIYNRALTAAEVLRNYNSGKNTYK